MENVITHIGSQWYSFKDLNQEGRYIKVHALNCGSEVKAIKRARDILNDKKAIIVVKESEA